MTEETDARTIWVCRETIRQAEETMKDAEARLKAKTGEREAGPFLVNVASFTRESIDGDAVKALLGAKTPMKASASVRLTVKKVA